MVAEGGKDLGGRGKQETEIVGERRTDEDPDRDEERTGEGRE
ncbi:MAG: hypothetical protein NTZ29_03480 [Verrucomicrobia bacterium]|nr:hypothetical protein [Verrucomicrobiota bacterium]